jgi:hypothetical protein
MFDPGGCQVGTCSMMKAAHAANSSFQHIPVVALSAVPVSV